MRGVQARKRRRLARECPDAANRDIERQHTADHQHGVRDRGKRCRACVDLRLATRHAAHSGMEAASQRCRAKAKQTEHDIERTQAEQVRQD